MSFTKNGKSIALSLFHSLSVLTLERTWSETVIEQDCYISLYGLHLFITN